MIKDSLFYGKILLFGEYGIIHDSKGLSVPYSSYKGKLIFDHPDKDFCKKSNDSLSKFATYLEELNQDGDLLVSIDIKSLKQDIEEGICFDSTIPEGFGVGSSGALVAAIYDKYAQYKIPQKGIENDKIVELKAILGQMESFFHGKSSGLDPLICYLNLPILIKSKTELDTVGIPEYSEGKGAIFLLNTGNPGSTESMVNIYLEKCKQEGFRKMLKGQFKKYNDACIEAFLNKDQAPLMANIKKLSGLLLEHFSPMIPGVFQKLWKEGLESNLYYLKLCGSGGGGYILGFTHDFDATEKKLNKYDLSVIYNF